jgi:hypothetical protein
MVFRQGIAFAEDLVDVSTFIIQVDARRPGAAVLDYPSGTSPQRWPTHQKNVTWSTSTPRSTSHAGLRPSASSARPLGPLRPAVILSCPAQLPLTRTCYRNILRWTS